MITDYIPLSNVTLIKGRSKKKMALTARHISILLSVPSVYQHADGKLTNVITEQDSNCLNAHHVTSCGGNLNAERFYII